MQGPITNGADDRRQALSLVPISEGTTSKWSLVSSCSAAFGVRTFPGQILASQLHVTCFRGDFDKHTHAHQTA